MAASQSGMSAPLRAQGVRRLGFTQYKGVFGQLPSPKTPPLPGDYLAEFVGPAWLRLTAGPSLAP